MSQKTIKIIDPHLHLFALNAGQYDWLKPANPPFWADKSHIARSYTEQDLSLGPEWQLAGFVHIEAGFDNLAPWREIDYLQQHCQQTFRSVAFADITSANFHATLAQLSQRSSVVGIRHILDEQACDILAQPNSTKNLRALAAHGWSFDAQLNLQDSAAVSALLHIATAIPELRIIINHAGWPPLSEANPLNTAWCDNLARLAECKQFALKLSGWELLDRRWHAEQFQQISALCLNTFSDQRLMLASNFPLCEFSVAYASLWRIYQAGFSSRPELFERLAYHNAAHWYQFN